MLEITTHIPCLVAKLSLGPTANEVTHRFEKLLKSNGPTWLCQRLKGIWEAAKHQREGRPHVAEYIYQQCNIKLAKDGYPADGYHNVVKTFVETKSPKALKRAAAVLRAYTSLKPKKITEKALTKVKESITKDITTEQKLAVQHYADLVDVHLSEKLDKMFVEKPKIYQRLQDMNIFREDFTLTNLKPFTACYSPLKVPKDAVELPYSKALWSMLTSAPDISIFDKLPKMSPLISSIRQELGNKADKACGRIHILREGGMKYRPIAIPSAWIQFYFAPLHLYVERLTKEFYSLQTVVFDQNKGGNMIKTVLDRNMWVGSSDLSSATDRFPLSIQKVVLKHLVPAGGDWARALEEVAKGTWILPDKSEVSYSVGQPMGLYGSFPIFNLSHIILIEALQEQLERTEGKLKGFVVNTQTKREFSVNYQVLGDDVIFFNPKLKLAYDRALREMGIQVQDSKSYKGKELTEFAGFLVAKIHTHGRKRNKVVVFRPFKHTLSKKTSRTGHEGPSNLINLFSNTGSTKSLKFINRPYWRKIFKAVQDTSDYRNYDLSPSSVLLQPEREVVPTSFTNEAAISTISKLYLMAGQYLPTWSKLNKQEPIVYETTRKGVVVGLSKFHQVRSQNLEMTTENVVAPGLVRPQHNKVKNSVQSALSDPLIKEVIEEEKNALTKLTDSELLELLKKEYNFSYSTQNGYSRARDLRWLHRWFKCKQDPSFKTFFKVNMDVDIHEILKVAGGLVKGNNTKQSNTNLKLRK